MADHVSNNGHMARRDGDASEKGPLPMNGAVTNLEAKKAEDSLNMDCVCPEKPGEKECPEEAPKPECFHLETNAILEAC